MNKKVYKTILFLVIGFLCAFYIMKIFFPSQFIMVVEAEGFVKAGQFIDSHKWLSIIFGLCVSILGDYLYFGAVCRQRRLKWSLWVIILLYEIAFVLYYNLASPEIIMEYSNVVVVLNTCYMIFVPALYTKELKPLAITYTITSVAQLLTLSIRNLGMLMVEVNSITNLLVCFESYLWLVALFMLFTHRKNKEESNNGIY